MKSFAETCFLKQSCRPLYSFNFSAVASHLLKVGTEYASSHYVQAYCRGPGLRVTARWWTEQAVLFFTSHVVLLFLSKMCFLFFPVHKWALRDNLCAWLPDKKKKKKTILCMVCRLWAARYFIELRFKTRCSEHGVALIFLLSGFPKKNQTRINANWPFWATTELLAELLTTKSWSAGCLDAAVLVFLVLTMTLTSSSDNLASSSSAYFFLFTWRFDRLFCKKKKGQDKVGRSTFIKKKYSTDTDYFIHQLRAENKNCGLG